jgi:hypothetical protein
MSKELNWKNKLRKIRESTQKVDENAESQGISSGNEVNFPWFIFFVALINDLLDYLDPILVAATSGLWLGISETLGNIIDGATWFILTIWSYFSGAKSDPLTRYLVALIIELIPFGDFIPSWTAVVLAYYFKEKSLSKAGAVV